METGEEPHMTNSHSTTKQQVWRTVMLTAYKYDKGQVYMHSLQQYAKLKLSFQQQSLYASKLTCQGWHA